MSNSGNKIFPPYKVGVFQYEIRQETPNDRIDRLEEVIIKKTGENIDLIVCPELFMSGYGNPDDIKKYAEKANGPFSNSISKLEIKFKTSIIYG